MTGSETWTFKGTERLEAEEIIFIRTVVGAQGKTIYVVNTQQLEETNTVEDTDKYRLQHTTLTWNRQKIHDFLQDIVLLQAQKLMKSRKTTKISLNSF